MVTVAINGFGRIGRTFFRLAFTHPELAIVAVNDLGDIKNLAYLLQYDSAYGRSPFEVTVDGTDLIVAGKRVTFVQEKDPKALPWRAHNIDIVVESTGFFTTFGSAAAHLEAGAKRVVISAPAKGDDSGVAGSTVLMGVNEHELATCQVTSNASCTTNATSPLIAVLKESIGIKKALLSTVHEYTASQALVDGPKKDWREGRAAALNIVPTSTGAAIATTLAHPELANKFDGISLRVPVPVGSIVDVTFVASRPTSVDEVNSILTTAAASPKWQHLLAVTEEPLVSSDIIGARLAAIADLAFTRVIDGDLVKVLAWYDNETSYTHTLVEHVLAVAKHVAR